MPEAIARSAQAQQRAGNFAEAIKDYAEFQAKYASHALAESSLYQLGLCYGEIKDFDNMTKTLGEFVQKFPRSTSLPEANYWLGWNTFRQKQWAQATQYLTQSLGSATRAKDANPPVETRGCGQAARKLWPAFSTADPENLTGEAVAMVAEQVRDDVCDLVG